MIKFWLKSNILSYEMYEIYIRGAWMTCIFMVNEDKSDFQTFAENDDL